MKIKKERALSTGETEGAGGGGRKGSSSKEEKGALAKKAC